MQSIKNLVQGLKTEDRSKEFDAFKILDDNIKALENRIVGLEKKNLKYYCRAYRNATVAIPTGPVAAISFNATEYPQLGNMHDNTNDPDKIFIKRDGVYHMSGGVAWDGIAGGTFRQVVIRIVGTRGTLPLVNNRIGPPVAGVILATPLATSYYLYEGDYVQLAIQHDAGVAVDILALYPQSPFLSVTERMEDLDPDQYGLLDPNANTR